MSYPMTSREMAALDAYITREPDERDDEEDYDEDAALSSLADDQRKAEKEDAND